MWVICKALDLHRISVSQLSFPCCPPVSLIYLHGLPPFIDTVTCDTDVTWFYILDLYIRIYSYYFYLQCCVVYLLFVVPYTSKNLLLMMCIIFSVLFGLGEGLQVSECLVAVRSVISEDYLSSQHQGSYLILTANESVTQLKLNSIR
jgi:hypothetical protein